MANVFDVQTDLQPEALTEVAIETFRKWVSWSLGKNIKGLWTLVHPSGRYAASLSWKRTGIASIAIIADESIAPEVDWLERGHPAFSIKEKMLGKGNTKISKEGYRYRVIPMRGTQVTPSFNVDKLKSGRNGGKLPTKAASMWLQARQNIGSDRFATMSDKPGSSGWIIPPMAAYSPAAILADQLRKQYGTSRGVGS